MLGTQWVLLFSGSVSRQPNQAVGEKALPSLRASSIMQIFLGREDWKDTQALGGFVYQFPGLCESGALAQGHHAQWPRLCTAQLHRSRGDAIWQRYLDDRAQAQGWGGGENRRQKTFYPNKTRHNVTSLLVRSFTQYASPAHGSRAQGPRPPEYCCFCST